MQVQSEITPEVKHHFLQDGEIYAKEIHLNAGEYIQQHLHEYDHFGILTRGQVVLLVDGIGQLINPGSPVPILRHKVHYIRAVQPSTWLCVHHTSEKDPELVDAVLIKEE